MTAGLNNRCTIWRIGYSADDYVGGAVITGTATYTEVLCRFQAKPVQQLLLQQGLETERTFTAVIVPGTLDVRERDEFQLTHPYDSPYYSGMFRIVGLRYSDHNPRDPRNYLMLDMVRSVRSHANTNQ